jgi:predicted ester cyclase
MKTTNYLSLVLITIVITISSCTNRQNNATQDMEKKNMETMQKVFDAFIAGNTNIDEYVSADMIEHTPSPGVTATGLAGMKETITMFHTAFPDLKETTIKMFADSDYVVAHFNMKGTNSGSMGGMPATNKPIDVNGVDIVRFENGKGVEHWGYYEEAKMMQQMGMMPEPGKEGMPADSAKKM